jgi:hypothetical protein
MTLEGVLTLRVRLLKSPQYAQITGVEIHPLAELILRGEPFLQWGNEQVALRGIDQV